MYRKTVLPNGIRIITEQIPEIRSITLGVWFEVGSRDEEEWEQGYSHFVEHLLFKGSEKYSARDIAELIEGVGGSINAFTSKEFTCYYASCLDQDLPLVIDVLSEMLLTSSFSETEIERERKVILEEIKACEDIPEDLVHELFYQQLWLNHSLGKSILGTRDSITEASRDALIAYYRNHYLREKLVIVAAGNVDHDYLIDKFALKFSALAGSNPTNLKPELTPAATVKQRLLQAKPLEQTHICNGGAIQFSRFSEDAESLRFLDTLVGGGMSSRLFQELREIRGLVYHVYSDYSLYRDSGEYAIYAACSHQDYPLVLATITQELDKLTKQAILEPELKRIKGQLKGNLVLSLESTMNRMLKLAKDEYNYGRIVSVDETLTEIDAITADQILDHAKNIFKYEDWNLVVLGLA